MFYYIPARFRNVSLMGGINVIIIISELLEIRYYTVFDHPNIDVYSDTLQFINTDNELSERFYGTPYIRNRQ